MLKDQEHGCKVGEGNEVCKISSLRLEPCRHPYQIISEMHLTGIAAPPVDVDQFPVYSPSICRFVTHDLHALPRTRQVS